MNFNSFTELLDKMGFTILAFPSNEYATFYGKDGCTYISDVKINGLGLYGKVGCFPVGAIKPGEYFELYSGKLGKVARVHLNLARVNGKDIPNSMMVDHLVFSDKDSYDEVRISQAPCVNVEFILSQRSNGEYAEPTKINISSEERISVDKDKKTGSYDKEFIEGYGLSPSEMIDAIESNEFVQWFMDYYGTTYPKLVETVENAKAIAKSAVK